VGYPVPLSMTTAGRAVASMAVGSGEFPSAHASAAARWRSIAGRDLAPVPPDRIDPGHQTGGWRERASQLERFGGGEGWKPEGSSADQTGVGAHYRCHPSSNTGGCSPPPSPPPVLDSFAHHGSGATNPHRGAALLLSRFGWAVCRGQLPVRFIFHTRTSMSKGTATYSALLDTVF
jgi:hypothetical protein